MIEKLAVSILTRLGTWVYARICKAIQARIAEAASEAAAKQEIDARMARLEKAFGEAFNGDPVSKEQREKLNQEITGFIRSAPRGL